MYLTDTRIAIDTYDSTPVWRGDQFPLTLLDWAKPYEWGASRFCKYTPTGTEAWGYTNKAVA